MGHASTGLQVELDEAPGRSQAEESFVLTHDDGTRERIVLHDYSRVYAVPGLYEEVVQHQLNCASPQTLAATLADAVTEAGASMQELRVLDVGAGNGVVGEELHARGAQVVAGTDGVVAAREAARRDRPELYEVYAIAGVDEVTPEQLVTEHGLNALTSAGALGIGHVEVTDVARWWARSRPAPGSPSPFRPRWPTRPGRTCSGPWLRRIRRHRWSGTRPSRTAGGCPARRSPTAWSSPGRPEPAAAGHRFTR